MRDFSVSLCRSNVETTAEAAFAVCYLGHWDMVDTRVSRSARVQLGEVLPLDQTFIRCDFFKWDIFHSLPRYLPGIIRTPKFPETVLQINPYTRQENQRRTLSKGKTLCLWAPQANNHIQSPRGPLRYFGKIFPVSDDEP